MSLRSRQYETDCFKDIFIEKMEQAQLGICPKPRLLDSMYQREDLSKITLNNNEPVFD